MSTQVRQRVRVGMKFHSHYADGMPEWEVIRRDGPNTWICTVTDDPDWAGVTRAFLSRQILAEVNRRAAMDDLFQRADDWFDSLELGSHVHYCNGRSQYVRCKVVIGTEDNIKSLHMNRDLIGLKVLKPIAMVGTWSANDLPRRDYKGTVQLGFYPTHIIEGTGAWRPSTSCVWEAPDCANQYKSHNPHDMNPLDLALPVPDAETRERERLYRIISKVGKIANSLSDDPQTMIDDMRNLLDEA